MRRYEISDEVWLVLELLLPNEKSNQAGHPYNNHRTVLNGIFWVLCSGAPWRDVPERYGSWKTIYNRLLIELDDNNMIDWSAVALDGSCVPTSPLLVRKKTDNSTFKPCAWSLTRRFWHQNPFGNRLKRYTSINKIKCWTRK